MATSSATSKPFLTVVARKRIGAALPSPNGIKTEVCGVIVISLLMGPCYLVLSHSSRNRYS